MTPSKYGTRATNATHQQSPGLVADSPRAARKKDDDWPAASRRVVGGRRGSCRRRVEAAVAARRNVHVALGQINVEAVASAPSIAHGSDARRGGIINGKRQKGGHQNHDKGQAAQEAEGPFAAIFEHAKQFKHERKQQHWRQRIGLDLQKCSQQAEIQNMRKMRSNAE